MQAASSIPQLVRGLTEISEEAAHAEFQSPPLTDAQLTRTNRFRWLAFLSVETPSASSVRKANWGSFKLTVLHTKGYRAFFETRATKSSNLDSRSFKMGDWFDFL